MKEYKIIYRIGESYSSIDKILMKILLIWF